MSVLMEVWLATLQQLNNNNNSINHSLTDGFNLESFVGMWISLGMIT